MQSSITILEPAADVSLLTLYEAKIGLNLVTSSSESLDDLIEMLVQWSSAEIAAMCNRTFAKEKVEEIFKEEGISTRLYLSHYPVISIDSIFEDDVELVEETDYRIDAAQGKLVRMDTVWMGEVVVTYTGGYDLPGKAPKGLQQAAILMAREAYYASIRGDATIRMVAHKESRVIYFDPNAKNAAVATTGSPARRATSELLKHYMRFYV